MFKITARLVDGGLDPEDLLNKFGLEPYGRVQCYIDNKVIDECRPYLPASPNHTLEASARIATDIGSGQVIWDTPYAHYQYMGIVYESNIPIVQDGVVMGWFSPPGQAKRPTDRALTYDQSQNSLAGSYWFERMKADKLNDILDGARRVAKEGE